MAQISLVYIKTQTSALTEGPVKEASIYEPNTVHMHW